MNGDDLKCEFLPILTYKIRYVLNGYFFFISKTLCTNYSFKPVLLIFRPDLVQYYGISLFDEFFITPI